MKKIECVFPTHQLQQIQDLLKQESWRSASILKIYDGAAADSHEIGRGRALPTKCRLELLVEDDDISKLTRSFHELTASEEDIDLLVTNVATSLMIVPVSMLDRDDAR